MKCVSPGCREVGTFQPLDKHPRILYCDKHAGELLRATVRSIINGTHPQCQEDERK